MADFRKWLIAFAALALLLSLSTSANAALNCVANTGTPVVVRAEGITELMGDILITCTGGPATIAGQQIPQANITLSLNTNITSRLLGGAGLAGRTFIDALIIIDEATPGVQNPPNPPAIVPANPSGFPNITQSAPCFSDTSGASSNPANCNVINGTGGLSDPYAATNIFVARQQSANTITWLGIPIDPPGTANVGGARTIRITNVRGNACQLGVSSTLVPTQIAAFLAINSSQSITLTNPQISVASITPGLVVTAPTATPISTLQQCTNLNTGGGGAGGNFFGSTPAGTSIFTIRVQEGFGAAFKRRVIQPNENSTANTPLIGLGGGAPGLQNIPGFGYPTESGFVNGNQGAGTAPLGLADTGTRILIRFNNVGAGVRIVLPTVVALTLTDSATPGNPRPGSSLAGWAGGFIQLVGGFVDQFGNAGANVSGFATGTTSFTNLSAPNNAAPFGGGANGAAEIPVTNGAAAAVYEVINADPAAIERANIAVGIAFTSNTAQNLPAPGTVTTSVSFAPIGPATANYGTADPALPIPRFCDTSTAKNVFTINACTCNILFPFVTNQAGFDTGIAIANTTQDPFGTGPQSGTVVLNYFGNTTGGGAAPSPQTSTAVAAGAELTFQLSSGGTNGITATPGFQGYIIATAKFQFCHAFAFISDLGAQRLAEGYLGIILDSPGLNRTGITGENDAH